MHYSKISLLFLSVLLTLSCKKDAEPSIQNTSTINFHYTVDGNTAEFDTLLYTNEFGHQYKLETVKYFISNLKLVNTSNDTILIDDFIYVDGRDVNYDNKTYTNAFTNGNYTTLLFTFGIDSLMNQTGIFSDFPETAMEWPVPMGGGYHYMKLEGKFDNTGTLTSFNFHTGPLNNNPNYFNVSLPVNVSITDGSFNLDLEMQINNWFKNPNTFDFTAIISGMMGNQTLQQLVKENGFDVFKMLN